MGLRHRCDAATTNLRGLSRTFSHVNPESNAQSSRSRRRLMRMTPLMAMVLMAAVAGGCSDSAPTAALADENPGRIASANTPNPPLPIAVDTLAAPHRFTDNIATHVRGAARRAPRRKLSISRTRRTPQCSGSPSSPASGFHGIRTPASSWSPLRRAGWCSSTRTTASGVHTRRGLRSSIRASATYTMPSIRPAEKRSSSPPSLACQQRQGPLTLPVDPVTSAKLDAKCRVAAAMSHGH